MKQTRLTKGKFYLITKFLIEDIFHDKSVEDRAEKDRGGLGCLGYQGYQTGRSPFSTSWTKELPMFSGKSPANESQEID